MLVLVLIVIGIIAWNRIVRKYYENTKGSLNECSECGKVSVTQTSRPWWVRMHEHIRG